MQHIMNLGMPLGTRLKIAVGLVILVVAFAVLLTVLWTSNFSSDGGMSPSDIKPVASQYIKTSHYHNETRIYLVSAIPSYGAYPFEDAEVYSRSRPSEIHTGDPCLLINVTVRNNYDTSNPLPSPYMSVGYPNSTTAEVSLDALLYSRDNGTIEATNVTPPLPRLQVEIPSPIMSLKSGETRSFNMYLSTANHNVEAFTIVAAYVGAQPPP